MLMESCARLGILNVMLIKPREVIVSVLLLLLLGAGSVYYLAQRNGLVDTAYAHQAVGN